MGGLGLIALYQNDFAMFSKDGNINFEAQLDIKVYFIYEGLFLVPGKGGMGGATCDAGLMLHLVG